MESQKSSFYKKKTFHLPGTSDPYFELHVTTDGGKTKNKIFTSDTISDKENPDWGQIFEFDYDRSKNQVISKPLFTVS